MSKLKVLSILVLAASSVPAFAGATTAPDVLNVYSGQQPVQATAPVALGSTNSALENVTLGTPEETSIGDAKSDVKVSNQFANNYVSLSYTARNKQTKIDGYGVSAGLDVEGYLLSAEIETLKLDLPKESEVDTVIYSGSIMHPIYSQDSFEVLLGGKLSRMMIDSDSYNPVTSAYFSGMVRSTFTDSIGTYFGGDYHVWDNTSIVDGGEKDIHNKMTLSAGVSYKVSDQLYLSAGGKWGSDLDTSYGVRGIFKF